MRPAPAIGGKREKKEEKEREKSGGVFEDKFRQTYQMRKICVFPLLLHFSFSLFVLSSLTNKNHSNS